MTRKQFILLGLALCAPSIGHAQAPARGPQAWGKVPSIIVLSQGSDPRVQLVRDAVANWNRIFSEIGTSFRLGLVTQAIGAVPASELGAMSATLLSRSGPPSLSEDVRQWPGDLIVVLSDGMFVSFAARWPDSEKAVVAIRSAQGPPLSLPNVARNVIAHELGHAIGLGHNGDPTMLMCGRPAACRPDAFASQDQRYFPLSGDEKARILVLYPAGWKSR
jgi:hypothetical protein